MRRHASIVALVLVQLATGASGALAQLAPRAAEEWIKTLDSPQRVAGLKIDDVVAKLRLAPDAVVADIGAGSGTFEGALAGAVPKGLVYAVDIDQGLLDAIDRKGKQLGVINIKTVLGAYTDPRIPAKNVDLAFIHDVLHHIADRATYVKSLAGYLKPSGRIAIVEFLPDKSPHKDQPDLVVSPQQTAAWMAAAGLRPVEEVKLFEDKWYVIYSR